MKPFNEIEHSGDIGIQARGADVETLLGNMARGLFGLMVRNQVGSTIARQVTIRSHSFEELMIDWLSEIISCAAANGEVYGDLTIDAMGEHFVEATLFGETIDTNRHDLRFEVKAATYHGLRFERTGTGYSARVIFDL